MVLGKLPVPRRPTISNTVGQGPICPCSRGGWGLFGHFYSHLSFLSSFSLRETARYRLIHCLKGPLNPKQPTNQLLHSEMQFDFFPFMILATIICLLHNLNSHLK